MANIFNFSDWSSSITSVAGSGTFSISGNSISVTSGNSADAYTQPDQAGMSGVYHIPVEPSTEYKMSCTYVGGMRNIIFENGGTSYMHVMTGNRVTFTTQSTTTFLTFRVGLSVEPEQPLGSTVTVSNLKLSPASESDYTNPDLKRSINSPEQGKEYKVFIAGVQSFRSIEYSKGHDEDSDDDEIP